MARLRPAALAAIIVVVASVGVIAQLPDVKPQDLKDLAEKTGLDKLWKDFNDPKGPPGWPDKWDPLAPDDEQYQEDYDPKGTPQIPLQCAESPECESCFGPAYARLDAVRIRFEKLRRVGSWTKAYKDRAFALGDSAAGIHGLAGLAWVGERIKLEKSFKSFVASYESKYAELLEELEASLKQIAACEQKVYDEPDWYNRFGFIYYNFMADRYRWSD